MHILFADAVRPARLDALVEAGHTVDIQADVAEDALVDAIVGVDVLVVRSTRVDAAVIAAADRLTLIVRAGAGTNTIDTVAAAAAGVYVCNVPGRNAIAVAELAMGLLLAIDRRIPQATADLRAGRWNKTLYREADGLAGKRMAIVGLGAIGLALAERAKAFGISVTAVRKDRSSHVDERIRSIGIRLVDSLDELLGEADIVSVHVPLSPATEGLVNANFLAKLAHGAILINTARGEIMVEADVIDAMESNGLRVGLDVYPDEPKDGAADYAGRLAQHPGVIGTHHIGASTTQAQNAVIDGVIEVIDAYGAGQIIDCVNLQVTPRGRAVLSVRHRDEVGVLAQVLEGLRREGINVAEMSNRMFAGAEAAVASINVDAVPSSDVIDALEALDAVFGVTVQRRA